MTPLNILDNVVIHRVLASKDVEPDALARDIVFLQKAYKALDTSIEERMDIICDRWQSAYKESFCQEKLRIID